MNGIIELQTANKWLIDADFGFKAMRLVNAMMRGHLLSKDEKVYQTLVFETADGGFLMSADADDDEGRARHEEDTPFINVLHLEGPLTREGGACTYGSRQLRDLMMEAADHEQCLGHVLIINGPGGVSNAIPDFLQATDYARSKGQPIIGRIDGFCASAHIWVSAMCDEVYYNNPADKIGSVGIYWAGILNKDGDTDPESGGKWHIVYDPNSYDKNRFARDLADNNNDKLIKEELTHDGETFRAYVKSRRPNATEEHLHGKMFDCKDVEGILVTGQATMQEVFNRIVALRGNRTTRTVSAAATVTTSAVSALGTPTAQTSTTLNSINMKEKFPKIFALLGVEAMECKEDGTFFNASLLETLEGKIGEMEQANADAKALAEQLTKEKNELTEKVESLTTEHAAAIEQMKADHAQAIDTLKAEHQTKVDELNATVEEKQNAIAALEQEKADLQADVNAKAENIESLTTELNGAKTAVETAQQTIAERDQTISDLNAQIAELEHNPGEAPQAGAAPADNGQGAQAATVEVGRYVYDSSLPYEENMKLKEAFEKGK